MTDEPITEAQIAEALAGSVRKWERIAADEGADEGAANCPLCKLFDDYRCTGCPVKVRSGWAGCQGTPWSHWSAHHGAKRFPWYARTPEEVAMAQVFLDYLRAC